MSLRVAAVLAGTLACTYPKLPLLGDAGPDKDGHLADGNQPDSQPLGDAGSGGSNCPLLPEYQLTFQPGSGTALGDELASDLGSGINGGTETLVWDGILSLTPQADLIIQLTSGGGANTPDWPIGDVTPKSDIQLGSGATGDALIGISVGIGSDGAPAFGYLAVAGTLNVTEASPNLAGTVTNVEFRQYDNLFGSSAAGPTPDPDGCTTVMPSIDYDAPLSNGSGGGSGVGSAV
jgi:hypothetical protein